MWVIHETGHQIFVFSNDGSELLMTLGEKDVGANGESHFGRPQDVAFLPDGRILVADGLDNSRVLILDAEGNYITEFGEQGTGRGQFNGVHAVATGPDGRIFVADRDNKRVQVFNQTTQAAAWYHPTIAPIAVWMDARHFQARVGSRRLVAAPDGEYLSVQLSDVSGNPPHVTAFIRFARDTTEHRFDFLFVPDSRDRNEK